jgi:hypothetical protein
VLLQQIIDYAHTHVDESPKFQRIVEQEEDVKRNWRLVYLDGSMLSAAQQTQIDARIQNFVPRCDRMGLVKQLVKEGIGDFDVEDFFYAFHCIENLQQKTGDSK